MTDDKSGRLDRIFPADDRLSDEEVDRILDRTNHIGRTSRLALAGGAVALSVTVFEVIRRYRFSPGLPEDD